MQLMVLERSGPVTNNTDHYYDPHMFQENVSDNCKFIKKNMANKN